MTYNYLNCQFHDEIFDVKTRSLKRTPFTLKLAFVFAIEL